MVRWAHASLHKLDTDADRFINSLNFWIQAILVRLGPCLVRTDCNCKYQCEIYLTRSIMRLGPCLVLTMLSALLVKTMRLADARLKTLKNPL